MAAKKKASQSGARVALSLEEALEVGFFGHEVDPTPDENYSVAGTLAGKPVPESDADAAAAAEAAQKEASARDFFVKHRVGLAELDKALVLASDDFAAYVRRTAERGESGNNEEEGE